MTRLPVPAVRRDVRRMTARPAVPASRVLTKLTRLLTMRLPANCVLLLLLCAAMMAACRHKPAAFEYCPTPVEGWEGSDTLHFRVDTIREGGTYSLSLGVRSSASLPYPFQRLYVVVRQHWHHPEALHYDTVACELVSPDGKMQGRGVSIYQYICPVGECELAEGQTGEVTVHHIMRREILPGITDVGIRIERESTR